MNDSVKKGMKEYGSMGNEDDADALAKEYESLEQDVENGPITERAKKISLKTYGEYRWPFITWLVKRLQK